MTEDHEAEIDAGCRKRVGGADDAGRIVSLRHYEDTAAVRDAWR